MLVFNSHNFKYTYNQNEFLSPKAIEEKLDSLNTAQEKLEFVYNAIYCNKNKNRFAYFKDMPYNIPLPKYENKFKSLKFEEIDETKNHLSYKLGAALIKANKNWYKGGYVKFIFEAIKIKNEHKIK